MTKQSSELKPIKIQQVGRTLIAVVDGKKLPTLVEKDKEKVKEIKKLIESYNALPNKSKQEKIIKMFMPKTEAKLLAVKTEKKVQKNKIKELEDQLKLEKDSNSKLNETVVSLQKDKQTLEEMLEKVKSVPSTTSQHGTRRYGEY